MTIDGALVGSTKLKVKENIIYFVVTYGRTELTVIARENSGDVKASVAVVVTLLIFELV
jgi:hypothetical protein